MGPVPSDELGELALRGIIGPDDLVWRAGMAAWVVASRIQGLIPTHPHQGQFQGQRQSASPPAPAAMRPPFVPPSASSPPSAGDPPGQPA